MIQITREDIFGGITAAIVALPLALAFGVASGAGAIAGLYGAVFCGFFAAVFGGTRAQVSGPTGPMTVVAALMITHYADNLAGAFTTIMLAGLLQIGFGLAGLGRFIKLVPFPVVSGFMSGIGCVIIILQIPPLIGYTAPEGAVVVKLAALPAMLAAPHGESLILGGLAFAVMVLMPKSFAMRVPPPLLALFGGTLLGMFLFKDAAVIGEIPSGFPHLQWPAIPLAEFPYMVRTAVMLAILGSIDSLLTSLVADTLTRTRHDSNRELIGQGIGNTLAGMFGAIPGAGATMRTVVNIRTGARNPASGALHALVLLVIVLGFGDLAAHIPLAVLAGILFKVGIDIIDWRYLKRMYVAPRAGVIIMMITLGMTVLVDLMTAVAVGMVMASLLFVQRMSHAQMASAKLIASAADAEGIAPEHAAILEAAGGRILIFQMDGPLSFGAAKDIAHLLLSSRVHEVLIIDFIDVPFIDSTASLALEEVIMEMQSAGDTVIVCSMRDSVRKTLEQIGLFKVLKPAHVATDRLGALRAAEAHLRA